MATSGSEEQHSSLGGDEPEPGRGSLDGINLIEIDADRASSPTGISAAADATGGVSDPRPSTMSDDMLEQAKLGQWGRVSTLLAHADQTQIDRIDPHTGATLLHRAAYHGRLDTVKALIQKRANRNLQDKLHGCTPLHCAAARGFDDICLMLLLSERDLTDLSGSDNAAKRAKSGGITFADPDQAGHFKADPCIRNKDGETAGDRAQDGLYDSLASMLFHQEAGYNFLTATPDKLNEEAPGCCGGCMPRNAARTVVCLEKWIVVALMSLLFGFSLFVVIYSVQLQSDCSEDSDPTQWVAAACNVTSASATQVASVVDANIDVQIISSACAVTDVKTIYTSDALYTYASSLVVGSTATCYSYGDCLSSSGCSSCDGKMISIGGVSTSYACDAYEIGIISASCTGTFFLGLAGFFTWLFFFGPLQMKEPAKTR